MNSNRGSEMVKRAREFKLSSYPSACFSSKTLLNAVVQALLEKGTDGNYTEIIKEMNKGYSIDLALFINSVRRSIEKDVRQDDLLSLILLTASFEMMFCKLN